MPVAWETVNLSRVSSALVLAAGAASVALTLSACGSDPHPEATKTSGPSIGDVFTSTIAPAAAEGCPTAAPADGGWWPALTYRAAATSFPRTSRRSEDNSAGKLKRADLVRAEDPACTYDRVLRYNPATSRYEMDRPAPECSDYTTP